MFSYLWAFQIPAWNKFYNLGAWSQGRFHTLTYIRTILHADGFLTVYLVQLLDTVALRVQVQNLNLLFISKVVAEDSDSKQNAWNRLCSLFVSFNGRSLRRKRYNRTHLKHKGDAFESAFQMTYNIFLEILLDDFSAT